MVTLDEPRPTVPCLAVLSAFFARLHAEQIAYCHWKSNEHLHAALRGATDLDLLVARDAALPLTAILGGAGFRRFLAAPACTYPGIEDYLGLDERSGRMVHVHLHYQLTVGEPYLKGYRLPWERLLLARRRWDRAAGLYVSDPNMEFLLLVVRMALKLRRRDLVRAWVGAQYLREGGLREYAWLHERIDRAELLGLASQLIGEQGARLLTAMRETPPGVHEFRLLSRAIHPRLADCRSYLPAQAHVHRWVRELQHRGRGWIGRFTRTPVLGRRCLPQGGVIIAVLGSDGAGKSTLVAEMTRWLAWKTDVVPLYFGSGDGPASLLRRLLGALSHFYHLASGRSGARRAHSPLASRDAARRPAGMRRLFQMCWALALAREKRHRLATARRARDRGRIVICDRFPQSQIPGTTDGPLLHQWSAHRNRILSWLSRWESCAYARCAACPPDLVLKLCVSPQAASERKPGMDAGYFASRGEVVRALRYPPDTKVVEIDADQPLAHVMLCVKGAIWETL